VTAGPRLPVEVLYVAPRDPENGDTDERWQVRHDDRVGPIGEITYEPGSTVLYVWTDRIEGRKILTSVEIEHGRHVALVQAVAALLAEYEDHHGGEPQAWWRTPVARIGEAS
jgi:hypothetical protein